MRGRRGMREAVAMAIYDQYRPAVDGGRGAADGGGRAAGDCGQGGHDCGDVRAGAGADGSKDPFALRRAANGIVKILAEASRRCR